MGTAQVRLGLGLALQGVRRRSGENSHRGNPLAGYHDHRDVALETHFVGLGVERLLHGLVENGIALRVYAHKHAANRTGATR